ncbi:hypothetical protein C8J56DRAFT_1032072 [Mycena floridula]|nr:hypothetical protein C8J56DRAFT_1032072 [Mycena floridula]
MDVPRVSSALESIQNLLPNEITIKIIALCDTSSRAILCRVSKDFKELAGRSLYEIVELDDKRGTNSVAQFDETLIANPQYAAWVRELLIIPSKGDRGIGTSYLANRILEKTVAIRRLSLSVWPVGFFRHTLSFPHLQILDVANTTRDEGIKQIQVDRLTFAAFLNSHRTISHLSVGSALVMGDAPIAAVIDLPNLVTFRSSSTESLQVLQDPNQVQALWFSMALRSGLWDAGGLDGLARFPKCEHVVIETPEVPGYVQAIFQALTQYLPRLKSLILVGGLVPTLTTAIVRLKRTIENELTRMENLECFGIIAPMELQATRDMVDSWPALCPKLNECLFVDSLKNPGGRYKVVNGKAEPANEPCQMETAFEYVC